MIKSINEKHPSELSDLDKASILLLSMGETSAASVFKKMPREDVVRLSNHMAKLPGVNNRAAHSVIQSFFQDFSSHSGISGAPRSFLEKTLNEAIGKGLAQEMLDGIYGDRLRDDFQKLEWVPAKDLAASFQRYRLQMQATLLSFLPPATAGRVMENLPENTHQDLFIQVAKMDRVNDNILEELRVAVDECVASVSATHSANVNGIKQAADILNQYSGDRQNVLETMKLRDENLALHVTENMYDFATLANQEEETLSTIVDSVDMDQLALALKGADEAIVQAVMGSLAKRMAESLSENMEILGMKPVSQVDQARKDLMATIREMNEQETINYKIFEEKVVE